MENEEKKFLIFDTETTGLPKSWKAPVTDLDNWPRLVQIAWMICDKDGNISRERNVIIYPDGFDIPEESSIVHGITTRQAQVRGWKIKGILEALADDLCDTHYLVAHNINFDEKVVGAEFIRAGIKSIAFENIPRICTMESSINFCAIPGPYGFKYPKLSELHIKLFGEDFADAHDAMVDTSACARCFIEMMKGGVIDLNK